MTSFPFILSLKLITEITDISIHIHNLDFWGNYNHDELKEQALTFRKLVDLIEKREKNKFVFFQPNQKVQKKKKKIISFPCQSGETCEAKAKHGL